MSIAFKQARYYTKGRADSIRLIVIHDMESPEAGTTAENVASWFAGTTSSRASAHYNVDSNSIVQSVRDGDTAWGAAGANASGLHVEHAGYARQTRAQWLDAYGKAMLELSAALVAEKCRKYGIPVRHISAADILAGRKGLVGHADVSKAYPGRGGHTDPGPNFPWDYYLARVQAHYGAPAGSGGGSTTSPTSGGGSINPSWRTTCPAPQTSSAPTSSPRPTSPRPTPRGR